MGRPGNQMVIEALDIAQKIKRGRASASAGWNSGSA